MAQLGTFQVVRDVDDPLRLHVKASIENGQTGRVAIIDGVSPLGTSTTVQLAAGHHVLHAVEWGTGRNIGTAVGIDVPLRPIAWAQQARAFAAGITPVLAAADGSDLILAAHGQLSILRASEEGGFGPPLVLPGVENPVGIAVADFDGDGNSEIAVAGSTGTIVLRRHDGSAWKSFQLRQRVSGLAMGDFNGDGIPDLAVANPEDNSVTVLIGKGDGTFDEKAGIGVGRSPRAVIVADLNADGIADIATANNGSNDVTVLLGNGHGEFRNAGNFTAGNGPDSLAVIRGNQLAVLNRIDRTAILLEADAQGALKAAATLPNIEVIASAGDELATGRNGGEVRVAETLLQGGPAPVALVLIGSRLVETDATGMVYVLSGTSESGVSVAAVADGTPPRVDEVINTKATAISLGTTSVVVGATPGFRSVYLSGTGSWTATSNAAWLHLPLSSGTDAQAFKFTFDANPGATRSGTITFNGGLLTLTVAQAPPGYGPAGVATPIVTSGLSNPSGLAVDPAGNVFISDYGNRTLKEWNSSTKQVTTLVSTGLIFPFGIAIDGSGNVYIADQSANSIKVWNAGTQQLSTLLSTGLSYPLGVAVDAPGNVYIADSGNLVIKKWDAVTKQVATLISSVSPRSIALDASGDIYFTGFAASSGGEAIQEWSPITQQTTILGSVSDSTSLAVDGSGNVYDIGYSGCGIWDVATHQSRTLLPQSSYAVAVDGAGNIYCAGYNSVSVMNVVYLNPAAITVPSNAGNAALPAVVPATTPLTPSSDQSWLTIGSVVNGVVNFSFGANPNAATRVANISLFGTNIQVTQAAGLTIGTSTIVVGPAAGTSSVALGATSSWTAIPNATWIHLTANNANGNGNQNVSFNYDANPGTIRTGSITFIGNNSYFYPSVTVTQMGPGYVSTNPVSTLVSSGLNGPSGVAVDVAGNVIIADTLNNAVKAWNPSTLQVSTLVSSGLNRPSGVTVDASRNVFIADSLDGSGMIKEWNSSTQLVSTPIPSGLFTPTAVAVDSASNLYFNATTGTSGVSEWNALTQQIAPLLPQPAATNGVALDNQGQVYFESGNALEVWSPANPGTITQLATGLNGPAQLAVDGSGNVYVADSGSNSIKVWNFLTKQLSTLVSTGLSKPAGVAVDGSGNVYIADTGNNAIKLVTAAFVNTAGVNEPAVSGTDTIALVYPATLAFSAASDQNWLTISSISNGVVSFAFTTNTATSGRVAHITALGQSIAVTQAAGGSVSLGATSLVVLSPTGTSTVLLNASTAWTATANAPWLHLATGSTSGTDSQAITFTSDANGGATRSGTITINNLTLTVTQTASGYVRANPLTLATGLNQPQNIAVDGAGNVFWDEFNVIKRWSAATQQVTTVTSKVADYYPGIAADAAGNLYIADAINEAILKWSPITQQVTTLISSGLNQLPNSGGIAVDNSGNLFIIDGGTIKQWSPATQQITTALAAGVIYNPYNLAVDPAGNLYVNASGSLFKWSVSTHQATLIGTSYIGSSTIAADGFGNVYFADAYGSLIHQISPSNQVTALATVNSPQAVASDAAGNIYFLQGDYYSGGRFGVIPAAYVNTSTVIEPSAAGSDSLPPVIPSSAPLTGVYAPTSDQSWLTIGNAANGRVPFSFTANPPGAPRLARVTELGQVVPIMQPGLGLSTSSVTVGPSAGTTSAGVLATQSWTAVVNAPWIHLSGGGASGSGNQAVVFSYDTNNGETRSGTITFSSLNQTVTLNLIQLSTYYFAVYPNQPLALPNLTTDKAWGVAVDNLGNVYFTTSSAIMKWTAATQQVTTLTSANNPTGVAVDSSGNVYYTDYALHVWSPVGLTSTQLAVSSEQFQALAFDSSGNAYLPDVDVGIDKWTASTQQLKNIIPFTQPVSGVAVDPQNNLYFTDYYANAFNRWNPTTQQVTTLTSGLSYPLGLASDLSGNIYIADSGNRAIKKWSASTQQLTTMLSQGLQYPHGVAVDASGNLYIADTNANTIVELPLMLVNTAGVTESGAAGTDSLPPAYPASMLTSATSDQPWLTIGPITNGVVNFSFSANTTGAPRVAHISVFGQGIPVTQTSNTTPTPKLIFSSQPANTSAGSAMPAVSVQLLDASGNPLTGSSAAVTLTSNPAGVTATANATFGIATFFGLVFNIPGTYTLAASSPGMTSATSNSFLVASANSIVVSGQVKVNGVGLSGVSINVTGQASSSATTDTAGNYAIALTMNGAYTVTASLPGYTFSAPVVFSNLTTSQTANFIGTPLAVSRVGVFRNGNTFLLDSNGNRQYDAVTDAYLTGFSPPGGAQSGDIGVAGDWTGNGHAKIGIFRPSTGVWWLDANGDGVFDAGDSTYQFGGLVTSGVNQDVPVVGDWSGSGKSCIGVFRTGSVWLLDLNCNGSFDGTSGATPDAFFPFGGLAGDVPVVGAWFAGQPARVGVVRSYAPGGVIAGPCNSSTNIGCPFFWVFDNANPNAGSAAATHQPAAGSFPFGGLFGDVFVSGDWLALGYARAGVYRQGRWLLDEGLNGAANHTYDTFFGYGGLASDTPITGMW